VCRDGRIRIFIDQDVPGGLGIPGDPAGRQASFGLCCRGGKIHSALMLIGGKAMHDPQSPAGSIAAQALGALERSEVGINRTTPTRSETNKAATNRARRRCRRRSPARPDVNAASLPSF